MREVKEIDMAVLTVIFSLFLTSQIAFANSYGRADDEEIFRYPYGLRILERLSQNSGKEYWEKLKGANVPLTLVNWQLITNPRSIDKYMDKRVIGTVKNNSRK